MKFRLLIFALFFLHASFAIGQLSIKNPQICHDKDNYLKCYNDGNIILKFGNGDFNQLITTDSTIFYSNTDKTFTIYKKSTVNATLVDTIQLKLLPNSILIQKGQSVLEINSLAHVPSNIYEFGVGTYAIGNKVKGFVFYSADKYLEIKVRTYGKIWNWDIQMKENSRRFSIQYNNYKNNRLSIIFIQDDSLRYGMIIGTTFNSLKKISRLYSDYTDSVGTYNAVIGIGSIPLDKYYYYNYNKSGKLIIKTLVGELKLCDCD